MNKALPTQVAHADYEEHMFCGRKLFADLQGRTTFVALIARALGMRRTLSADELGVLDDLAVITTVADPRIWPLKLIRVISSYGSIYPAWAAAHLCLERAMIGPDACGRAATVFVSLRAPLEHASDAAIDEELERRFPSMLPPVGFGVPFRTGDERVIAVRAALKARGRTDLPYWKFFERLSARFLVRRNFVPNIGAAFSAAALDLGFDAAAISPLATALVEAAFVPNAVEGRAQSPEVLRTLPPSQVEYRGKEPRSSPRALAAGNMLREQRRK